MRPGLLALLVFAVLVAPEIGRMLDFRRFETFDPGGPGLGNLFGQISPFEALGIWPSGDFRLTPGDGAVPAVGYYAGVALALVLLAWGLVWSLRRGETALPAAFVAAAAIYAATRIGGTPYTAAKAVAMAAPLAMAIIVRPLLELPRSRPEPSPAGALGSAGGGRFRRRGRRLLAAGARQRARSARPPTAPALADAAPAALCLGDAGAGAADRFLEDEHGRRVPGLGAARRAGLHRAPRAAVPGGSGLPRRACAS